MTDVIVYKPSPYELVFIHDKLLGLRLGFIIYRIKHERVYVSNIWYVVISLNKNYDMFHIKLLLYYNII